MMGVLTRSSMSALLLTMLFWFSLWLTQKIHAETGRRLFAQIVSQSDQPDMKTISSTMDQVHDGTGRLLQYLPKTRETADLFRRFVKAEAPHSFMEIQFGRKESASPANSVAEPEKPILEVVTSGLIFEAVLLLLAYWHFATRDF